MVWLVALVQLVNVLDFMMVMPLGPDFARALGIPEARLGIVGGSYTAAAAAAGLICSRFLDRFDRRSALAVTMLGLAVGTFAGGHAVDLDTLVAARVVAGAFGGPATALSLAIVADVVPPDRRGRAMSVVSAAFSVSAVFGVPTGLALARLGSWRTPFFAIAGVGVVVTLVAFTLLPPLCGHLSGFRTQRASARELVRRPAMALSLAAAGALTFSIFLVVPNLSAFVQHNLAYPRSRLELLYLVGGTASFAVLRATGVMVDRVGAARVAAFGTAVLIATVALGFLPSPPLLPVVVTFVLFMSTASLRTVPLQTLASRLPAPAERAQFMALQSAVQHVSSSLGAFVAAEILAQGPGGTLRHMPAVLILSMATTLFVPVLLWQVEVRVPASPQPGSAIGMQR